MQLFSPAKLNLFFRVLGKREDGFHEIASLYQAISLFDIITLSLAKKDAISCSNPAIPTADNLATKALRLFRQKTGISSPISLYIEKNISLQSGLGGGSSNAATALWGLNELFGRPLTIESLKQLGGQIGSDVPFFFSLGSAYCSGRGEIIENIPSLPAKSVSLFHPAGEGLSTPKVYQSLDLSSTSKVDPKQLLHQWEKGECPLHNDLENSAFALAPEFAKWRTPTRVMTGSGSAFFSVEETEKGDRFAFISRLEKSWYTAI